MGQSATGTRQFAFDLELQRHVQILRDNNPILRCPFGELCQESPMGFKNSTHGKESACQARDVVLISGSGRSPGGGNGKPL